jgi:hypothetical protein
MSAYDNNWRDEAEGAARVAACGEIAEIERGALPWDSPGVSVVFGNDGYDLHERARSSVDHLRGLLGDEGIEELGFGTSGDGATWAMLVRHSDFRWLTNLVWTAWKIAGRGGPMRPKPR